MIASPVTQLHLPILIPKIFTRKFRPEPETPRNSDRNSDFFKFPKQKFSKIFFGTKIGIRNFGVILKKFRKYPIFCIVLDKFLMSIDVFCEKSIVFIIYFIGSIINNPSRKVSE